MRNTIKPADNCNIAFWNELTKIHYESEFYDVEGFRNGNSTLKCIERRELGPVSNKQILHLQCHFGLDSLSLSRLGAHVTGVDYSSASIDLANRLSRETNIPARFICANVYDLPEVLGETFDMVFCSYGILHWLADLNQWATVIAAMLRPGGTFYMAEFHPLLNTLDPTGKFPENPYFHHGAPLRIERKGSYVHPQSGFVGETFEWYHSIADVLNSLLAAGLKLDYFHEFPYTVFNLLPYLKEVEPDQYTIRDRPFPLPLTFSVKATLCPS